MKKIIIYLLIFSLIITLLACSETQTKSSASVPTVSAEVQRSEPAKTITPKRNYNFAIVYGAPHPFFDPWRFGAQAAAEDLGIPVPNVTCPPDWDQDEQNALIDSLVTGGVRGFGIFTSDAIAGNNKISELADKRIPVVSLGGSPATPTMAKFCYATDPKTLAASGVQAAIDELKRRGKTKGNIILIYYDQYADFGSDPTYFAIMQVFDKPENKGFKLYKTCLDYDTAATKKAISKLFSSYLKHADAVVCTDGYEISQFVAEEMNIRNKKDNIVAIGTYDSPEVLSAINNGNMFGTITWPSWAMGYVGTTALKLFTDGYTWKKDAPFFIDSGRYLLTKDGLDTYQQTQQQIAYDFVASMKDKYFDPPVE